MKKIVLLSILLCLSFGNFAYSQLASWNVNGVDVADGTGIDENVSPYSFTSLSLLTHITDAKLSLSASVNPTTTASQYGCKVSTYPTSLSEAIAAEHYIQISITVERGYYINFTDIEMDGETSGSGWSDAAFMSEIAGYTNGNQLREVTSIAGNTGGLDTDASGWGSPIDLSGSGYQGVTGTTTFRIYGWGATGSSGTNYIRNLTDDNFIINGSVLGTPGFWSGTTNFDWNTETNWNDGNVPTSATNVTIPTGASHFPTITEAATCNNINIENGASLVGSENLTVNGTATMQRTIDGYAKDGDGWHLLSSPVNNMVIASSDFEPGTSSPNLDDFYGWDEPTFYWLNQKVGANNITNFVNGEGYLVSYETASTKDFTGTFNNTDVTWEDLSKNTDQGNGWHLLGNPFQSALYWTNSDWARTRIYEGAKILNSGGTYTDITVAGTNIIPANQGFFVQATVHNDNSITIPIEQCTHDDTPFYKSSIPNMLTLKAENGNYYQESCIQFIEGSTVNYDENYDVHFLAGLSAEAPVFYSILEEDNLSTNRIPTPENETIVPMAFSTSNEATVSINAEGVVSFAPNFEILLEDLQEGVIIDLRENPIYTFESNPEYDAERFRVHFKSATGINEGEDINSFNIYSFDNSIYVNNPDFQNANVFVYNLIGQEVVTFKINGDATNSFQIGVPSGYYFVKVFGDQAISTKKVYLK